MERIYPEYKEISATIQNERGSVIVIALITLVALTLIGIMASMTSQTETQIATNDMLYKQAFYSADGGTEITRELIEQSLGCPTGFPATALSEDGELVLDQTGGTQLRVTDPLFAYQEGEYSGPGDPDVVDSVDDNNNDINDFPSDDAPEGPERDLWFVDPESESNGNDAMPHTNVVAFGDTQLSTGSAIQMAAGYSGKGKGAGGAGGQIVYQVHSRHEYRARRSESYIMMEYRHMIGQEGVCEF